MIQRLYLSVSILASAALFGASLPALADEFGNASWNSSGNDSAQSTPSIPDDEACAAPEAEAPIDDGELAPEGWRPKGVAILIPGTFNSLPQGANRINPFTRLRERTPYFSKDILEAFESQGYATYVVRDLKPTAKFEWNGEQTLAEARSWYARYFPKRNVPITLVGHSAGGIYALYTASFADELPIRNILMVSTPLQGVPIADRVATGSVGRWFAWLCDQTRGLFDLRGLVDLTADRVALFLGSVSLRPGIQILAAAGYQPRARNILQASFAEFLSHPMAFTSEPEDGATDGIVPVDSSYGTRVRIADRKGSRVPIRALKGLEIKLDHMEQMLDHRMLAAIGTLNRKAIQLEQRRGYAALAAAALAP